MKPANSPSSEKRVPAGPIEWTEIRSRLERVAAGLEAPEDGAELDALLQRRARELARPMQSEATRPSGTECVVFQLDTQTFALEARCVREAVAVAPLTPLPGLPATFRGLANLRGQILPVFSLKVLLNLPNDAAPRPREEILVIEWEGAAFGVAIDVLHGAAMLPLERLSTGVPGLHEQFLRGLTPDGVGVLDVGALALGFAVDESGA